MVIISSGNLVMTNIAIEHGPVEIVSVPSKNGDFPELCQFTRG